MRAIILAIVVVLAGCETMPQQQGPDPRFVEVMQWRKEAMQQAREGKMKWSDFYIGAFERTSTLPNTPLGAVDLQLLSELIKISRKYEAGEITAEQFSDARRDAAVRFRAASAQLEQQQEAENEARRRAAIQMLGSRPAYQPYQLQPYQMPNSPPSPPTNCTSYVSGGQLITNCQ